MKLTNRKMVENMQSLITVSQKQLPVKVSYAIAKNIRKIENEFAEYNIEREKLLGKYSLKNEEGKVVVDENNLVKIKEECIEACNKDLKELLDIEVDINIHKFKFEDLGNITSISAGELLAIDYMIQEEE
ncbi:hypothetical protein [Terrisporobacter mayombei]|uniref:DUF1617 domain-containing protein n=1 Tax=Terrisporobacter mayombei TaxID=1541 RepID=A0ABY9PXV4_9FIRM|nr:hypothetical protein [Terrisporobacter mayombei]MCC3870295.1 hypothetical protein [Terrisporobacter mayombei]WMT79920.1 hypothetical protein TEMA_01910 [Terrisporobacter mayombei]